MKDNRRLNRASNTCKQASKKHKHAIVRLTSKPTKSKSLFYCYYCCYHSNVLCVSLYLMMCRVLCLSFRLLHSRLIYLKKNEKEMVFILHVMCLLFIRNSDEKSAQLKPCIKCLLLDCSARVIKSMNDSERKRAIEKRTILLIRRMCILMWIPRKECVCMCVNRFCFVFPKLTMKIRNFYWVVKKNARHFWMRARVTQRTSSLHYT